MAKSEAIKVAVAALCAAIMRNEEYLAQWPLGNSYTDATELALSHQREALAILTAS